MIPSRLTTASPAYCLLIAAPTHHYALFSGHIVSQPVGERLGGICVLHADLACVQLRGGSTGQAVNVAVTDFKIV